MKTPKPDSRIGRPHCTENLISRAKQRAFLALALLGLISVASAQTDVPCFNAWSHKEPEGNMRGEHCPLPVPSSGGIKEVIAEKYKKRYQLWKNEFLSTEVGRTQWEFYAHHPRFVLTITISRNMRNGAQTSDFKWSHSGELMAATITLSSRIDEGLYNPAYYPVTDALAQSASLNLISKEILAASTIAHEFGHVNRVASINGTIYQLQQQLIPVYNSIFRSNGFNTRDPQLIELAQRMGATPVELHEESEYWGEANAVLYLRERIVKKKIQRLLFCEIKRKVEWFVPNLKDGFLQLLNQNDLVVCFSGSLHKKVTSRLRD